MSKTLKMIKDELPRTMGELNHNLLYQDICQAVKEVDDLAAERDLFKKETLALAKEAMRYKDTLHRISSMCKVGCVACEAIYIKAEAALEI